MKSSKIVRIFFILLFFIFQLITIKAQQSQNKTTKTFDCSQNKKEKTLLLKETDKNEYRVKSMEFWGAKFIRD